MPFDFAQLLVPPTIQESLPVTKLVRWLSMLRPQPLGSDPALRLRATSAPKPMFRVVALLWDVLLFVGLVSESHDGRL